MVIRATDRVADVLKADASLIDVFVSMSPAFERLRNPAARKVIGRLVTLQQAARMGGVEIDALLDRLNNHEANPSRSGGEPVTRAPAAAGPVCDVTATVPAHPGALAAIAKSDIVEIDVREELRAGREPFSQIMAARAQVPAGGALCVRATFEPVPLYAVMQKQHLTHWTEQRADDDWLVWFYPEMQAVAAATPSVSAATPTAAAAAPHAMGAVSSPANAAPVADGNDADVRIIDVRGLEPPEPMMRTLAALEDLPVGATLIQLNVRVPKFLLPLLEERGCTYDIREQDDELVRLFIRRKEAARS
jgi:uncharacterized protein (DUF2249 family)